tara:strand:+ start:1034 stop:1933 length:900 start_codon:yes stop_codon:yes gene_type:complete
MFTFPEKMQKVFQDDKLQEEFEENGYVIVPYYNAEEVAYLSKLYRDLHPKDEEGFFPSTFSKDKNYRICADEEIRNIGNRSMQKYLCDYKTVCGSFIVKSPGENSLMDVHQDMTLVDETKYTGINIWCPLLDLTKDNGLLFALPKSHRLYPTFRGSSVPNIYEAVYDEIKELSTPLYLKAGEAVIFDQSIIHWSLPNLSDEIRPVTNTYFTHKEATFRICYYDKEKEPNKVEVFAQDDTFMTNFEQFGENIFDRPKIGKSLGFFDYDFPKLTIAELEIHYGKLKTEEKTFFEKVKSFFQ